MKTNALEAYALFDTARGTCGISWTARGVTCIILPEKTTEDTRRRLKQLRPKAYERVPQKEIQKAIALITDHLDGNIRDLSTIKLDMTRITPFAKRAYKALQKVEPGSYLSYGELARKIRKKDAPRAIGRAMAANPYPLVVPCHRVLASGKAIGGFSAYGGRQTKVELLALEKVVLPKSALGLSFEPAEALETLSKADPAMAKLIKKVGPLRLIVDPLESPFAALVKAIVYQQLSGKSASAILDRLKAGYGGYIPRPEQLLAASDESLREAGISRNKMAALRDLAQKTIDGQVPTSYGLKRLDDESIIERLITIKGIGRWSVEMLLIFRLGRPDVFPVDDYGVRKGLAALTGAKELPKPREAGEHSEIWAPFRTAASWYLWRMAEMQKN